jgi:hypothetical protein
VNINPCIPGDDGAGRPPQASDAVRLIPRLPAESYASTSRSRDKIVQQLRRAEPLPVLTAVHELEVAGVAVQQALLLDRHGASVVAVLQAQRQRHASPVVAAEVAGHAAVRDEPRVAAVVVLVHERVLQEAAAAVADGALVAQVEAGRVRAHGAVEAGQAGGAHAPHRLRLERVEVVVVPRDVLRRARRALELVVVFRRYRLLLALVARVVLRRQVRVHLRAEFLLVHLLDHRLPQTNARVDKPVRHLHNATLSLVAGH